MIYKNGSWPVIMLLLNSFVFAIASGINSVSLPFILYKNFIPAGAIGISSSIEIFAGMIISLFLFKLSKKIGMLKLMALFAILDAIVILILPFYQNYFLWILLVFIHGFSWYSVISLRQAWINVISTDQKRALTLALISTMICSGYTLGPLIVKLVGAGEYLVFICSSFCEILSCYMLFLSRKHEPILIDKGKQPAIGRVIRYNFENFLVRFLFDFQCAVTTVFTVIYGIDNGFSPENAGILVAAFMGISFFDFAIGFIIRSDAKKSYINTAFAGCLFMAIAMPMAMKNFYAALIIFAIFGWFASLGLITCATKINNNRKADETVNINSVLQAFGLLGALCGTLIAGFVMQIVGFQGFVLTIALSNIIYFAFQFYLILARANEKA